LKQQQKERKIEMKQSNSQMFTIDLSKIDGAGDFPCPYCGIVISPDDKTEDVYRIVDTKAKGESLEELTLQCSKCGIRIRLIGFSK
jgi:predicted RNA-binding Zn-ribbon protein involved in translation (DUF1610 family)